MDQLDAEVDELELDELDADREFGQRLKRRKTAIANEENHYNEFRREDLAEVELVPVLLDEFGNVWLIC